MTPRPVSEIPPDRRIFGNRTLNLRSIRAIGYDMDYTLIHYRVDEWERRAYHQTRSLLQGRGWPVDHLEFDPTTVIRGLTLDLELGNLVKPTRFGYVIKAAHGTRFLDFDELRRTYQGTFVDLSESRFVFLNTLFSLSEAALFAQLVDLFDADGLPSVVDYAEIYRILRAGVDDAHQEGTLKSMIADDPDRFVVPDDDLVPALLDQQGAGKRLLLITNSEWHYTKRIMAWALDDRLPAGSTWRDLFETVIVAAAKPGFFESRSPLFRIVDEERGLLQPHFGELERGGVYHGGNAADLEKQLGLAGDQILYVGDHLFADVHVSKALLRWRTALILRELESELRALSEFQPTELALQARMQEKEALERRLAIARLDLQHAKDGSIDGDPKQLGREIDRLQTELERLDEEIAPMARAAGALRNEAWGPLMRSGNDKSLFARQVERYADVYTSRVSNFGYETPYAFLRAARGTLPHDPA